MSREYPRVMESFFGTPWLIRYEKMMEVQSALLARIKNGPAAFDDDFGPPRERKPYDLIGGAALIPVHGTISPRPSLFASGGSSAEEIGSSISAALADGKVEQIVLDMDTPGGAVHGIPELASQIREAKRAKPVVAVVNHTAASAGYWLASQASEVVMPVSSWVGSVGVMWPRVDASAADEQAGIKVHMIVSDGSPHKNEDHPSLPATDAELVERQRMVNELFQQMASSIAKGRGVKASTVERDFGKGRMMFAEAAIAAGMADRIDTLSGVIGRVNSSRSRQAKRRMAAQLAAAQLMRRPCPIGTAE